MWCNWPSKVITNLCWASYLGSQHEATCSCSLVAYSYRSISAAHAQATWQAADVDWWDSQMDRQTPDSVMNPAMHTMSAALIMYFWIIANDAISVVIHKLKFVVQAVHVPTSLSGLSSASGSSIGSGSGAGGGFGCNKTQPETQTSHRTKWWPTSVGTLTTPV